MKLKGKTIAITGGTGFLGHHLVKRLVQEGARPVLLIQPNDQTWRIGGFGENVALVRVGLYNETELRAAFREIAPVIVVHLAGWMERKRDFELIPRMLEAHLFSTVNILKTIDPQVTRLVVNTGTSEEYGEQPDPFSESLPIDAVSPYSASKGAATVMAAYMSKAIDTPVVTMRPFIVYGPGQLHDTLIPFLIKGVLERREVKLTEGLQRRDFLFVADLVECYCRAMECLDNFHGPEIFNVGSGVGTRVCDVVHEIARILDGAQYLKIGAIPMRPGEPESMVADITKATERLGWEPRVSLAEGLRETIAWWQGRYDS